MKMEIKVVAIAPDDGWAFIVKGDSVFLLRPPYLSSNIIEVSEEAVERAISSLGFDRCEVTFSSIVEVVRYLKEEYIKSMKDRGIKIPSSEKLKDIMKYATDNILLEYLDKAKNELIPRGKLDAAASLAFDLIELEKVKSNPKMLRMAVEILEVWNQRNLKKEKMVSDELKKSWARRFPNAVKRYSITGIIKRQQAISRRGQLFHVDLGG